MDEENLLLEKAEIHKSQKKAMAKEAQKKKINKFLKPTLWGALLSVIPIGSTIIILLTSIRFSEMVEVSVPELLSAGLDESGVELALSIYDYRFVIIGIIWSVYIVIMLLLFVIEVFLKNRRKNES